MKKLVLIALAIALVFSLAACGNKSGDGASAGEKKTEDTAGESTDGKADTSGVKDEEAEKKDVTIRVGASPKPHAEILEFAKPLLEAEGYKLETVVFDDYILPNTAVEEGEMDANYFQHIAYMNDFNKSSGTHIVTLAKIHYEPFAIYSNKLKNIADLPDGAKVAIPNDATNGGRALILLAENGIIKLKEEAGVEATEADIVENSKNIEIVPVEARLLPTVLQDVDIAIINGNYAIDAGLKVSEALAIEKADGKASSQYVNILSVKEGNEQSEKFAALAKVLKSDEVKKFIEETYAGAVVSVD